jgi:haloacid dehalogenase-like hydrolase
VAYVLERAGIGYTMDEVRYLVAQIEKLRPFPEVPEALARLKCRYRLIVLSNGDPDMLEAAKRHHRIAFDDVISAAVAGTFKPHVRTYTKAAELARVRMEEVLFVANHAFDCIGAKSAGMRTAFIDRSLRPFGITPIFLIWWWPACVGLARPSPESTWRPQGAGLSRPSKVSKVPRLVVLASLFDHLTDVRLGSDSGIRLLSAARPLFPQLQTVSGAECLAASGRHATSATLAFVSMQIQFLNAAIPGSPSALDKIVGKLAVHCVAERTNEAARRQI